MKRPVAILLANILFAIAVALAAASPALCFSGAEHHVIRSLTSSDSPYTPARDEDFFFCDASGGAVTVDLPTAYGGGRVISIKKTDSSSNFCTLARTGSDTIDGQTSTSAKVQYALRTVTDQAAAKWAKEAPDYVDVSDAVSVTVSGATTLSITSGVISELQNITMSATATIKVPAGNHSPQFLVLNICQDGTGGRTPTVQGDTGITIKGSFPTFTTTASKCDICGLIYTASNTWQISGCSQNE